MSTFQNIVVSVEKRSNNPHKPLLKLFERQIEVDSSISVPYQNLIASMRFLFGSDVVVSFRNTELSYNNK